MTVIEFPYMRALIVDAVTSLAHSEYQWQVWIRHELPHPKYGDNFDLQVHILFDDTQVGKDPESYLGLMLLQDEVEPMRSLGSLLQEMIDDLGNVPDEAYLRDPRWTRVIALAEPLRDLMAANDATHDLLRFPHPTEPDYRPGS